MSKFEITLMVNIVKEFFGDCPAKLTLCLLQHGKMDFSSILHHSKIKLPEVKRSISVLIHHNIVDVVAEEKISAIFSINFKTIHNLLNLPRYAYIMLRIYGENGQTIFEEFSKHSRLRLVHLMDNILTDTSSDKLNESRKAYDLILCEMKEAMLIVAIDKVVKNPIEKNIENKPTSTNLKKNLKRQVIEDDDDEDVDLPPSKKSKLDANVKEKLTGYNDDVYWRLNFEKFEEILRHDIVANVFLKKIDKNASDLVRIILQLSSEKQNTNFFKTPPVSYNEIICLSKKIMSSKTSEQLLKILTEELGNCIVKEGESAGGLYALDWTKFFNHLSLLHIESVVLEKFGSKALRIFRVVHLMQKVDQKIIENLVMLEPKQTKELTYRLVQEGFISITEVPRSADHAPLRTIYLFNIDLQHIVRSLLQNSYKALLNLMLRRQHEFQINRRVIEKHSRMEAILSQIVDEQQKKEFEEQMSVSEREQVQNYQRVSNMIECAELQVTETITVFEYFLQFCQ